MLTSWCGSLTFLLLQKRRVLSLLLELVESSPELFDLVLRYLDVADLRKLSSSCTLLSRVVRDEALPAAIQVRGHALPSRGAKSRQSAA